jgi:hypothetical protein
LEVTPLVSYLKPGRASFCPGKPHLPIVSSMRSLSPRVPIKPTNLSARCKSCPETVRVAERHRHPDPSWPEQTL